MAKDKTTKKPATGPLDTQAAAPVAGTLRSQLTPEEKELGVAAFGPIIEDPKAIAGELEPSDVGSAGPEATQVAEPVVTKVHPLVGETVLYTLPADEKYDERSHGQVRPATVVRVWSDTCVNLEVQLDGTNDLRSEHKDPRYAFAHQAAASWATSRNLDLKGAPGTWRPRA